MAAMIVPLVASLLAASVATVASAQVVGEFRWQTQPYCNVLTLMVVQQGAQFHLSGSDDLCGAGSAPVTGSAIATGGSVAIGVTIALPSGTPAHLTASIAMATVSGTWNDADGRSGLFVFNAAGGPSRPAPARAAVITATQLAPTIFLGTGAATTIARSDHHHDDRHAGRLVRLQMSPWDLAQRAVGTDLALSWVGGCVTTPAFVANPMIMPLTIPSGAEVRSAVVTVLFGGGTVSLIADAVGASGMGAPTTLASATSTGSNGTVTHTLTPSTPFVVQPGTTLRLDFIRVGLGESLCSVELLYTLPAVN